ncbi:MAG: hypothetical protein U0984_00950 [Prosthecobacter sp.]|nr:hypothetical protein [Prosthecobacter sp.]
MNPRNLKPACLLLALGLLSLSPAPAQDAKPELVAEKLRTDLVLPGVTLAQGVSEVTGVAISPLLGVSTLGAWKYWHTDAALRHRLPWYCHPYVWGTGMALLAICFLKDLLGTGAPPLVKKPLDFIELFEDKLSALVATAGFVPLVALAVAQYQRMQPDQALDGLAASGLATMPMASLLDYTMHNPWITIPVFIIAFGVVWLSSHAINVLIALSPFGIVDAGLKLIKLVLITVVTGSAILNPYLGAAVSLVFILIGALVAGWSFRLTLFGTLMGFDFLLNKRATSDDVRNAGVKGFLARRTNGVPVRTYGRLECASAGGAHFVYHPWVLLPARSVPVPDSGMALCKGLLHPTVAHRPQADARPRGTIILLPRYRRVEETIATLFGCQEVLDSALMRGFKAMRQWLRSTLTEIVTPAQ